MNPRNLILALFLCTSVSLWESISAEAEPVFTSLFDGETFTGWEHGGNWVIEEGAFYRKERGGSLTYTAATVPDDFELRFEWKVSRGCNSGVYYRPGQVEHQILDNEHSPYGENARQAAGSLFFCMAPRKDATKPFGQWNTGRILCDGTVIEHWLNGKRVLSFDYADLRWARYVALLGIRGGDLTGRGGRLWLQDHGQDVWFRNLRWRKLGEDEVITADATFEPLPVTGDALAGEQARVVRMRKARQAKAPRPNLVLILADDLGWGDVGCYGPSPIPTPNLDRLAREGVRCTDAHSPCSVCSPTRYGLLTGTDPFRRYHTSHVLFNGEPLVIRPWEATVASLLREAGYRAAVIGKWHLGLGDSLPRSLTRPGRGPNQIGFDFSFLVPDGHNMRPAYYLENGVPFGEAATAEFPSKLTLIDRLGYRLLEYRPAGEWSTFRPNPQIGVTLVEKAIAWLEGANEGKNGEQAHRHTAQPFFLFLPTCAIHDPHQPDPRFAGKSGLGAHGDYVMQFDWTVGEVFAALQRLGVADNTLMIVTSDNGGLPGAAKRGHDTSGPWKGHKGSAWEGGHRVPFLARWPAAIPGGRDSGALLSLTDIPATASALAGGFLPPHGALDSFDFLPALLDQPAGPKTRPLLVAGSRGIKEITLRKGKWKLLYAPEKDQAGLYDLDSDPSESRNLATAQPEQTEALLILLHRYLERGALRPGAIGPAKTFPRLHREREQRNQHLQNRFSQ